MKKSLYLIPLLLLNISCKEEEINGYDRLTAEEQQTIRDRGNGVCKDKATPIFQSFKKESNLAFTGPEYARGEVLKYELKQDASIIKTLEMTVWKQTPSAIFFIVSDSRLGSEYFLRILKTDNEKLIDDFFELYCQKPGLYSMGSGAKGPLRVTNEYRLPKAPNIEIYKDTHSFSFNELAFMGGINLTREIKVEDQDERPVGSIKNLVTTREKSSITFNSDDWSDDNFYTQKFCSLDASQSYQLARIRNVEGFLIDLNSANCSDSKPAEGWDLAI